MPKSANSNKKGSYAHFFFRSCMVCLFIGGFVYQTMEFLFLYWTYPTVVDIQQSSPSYIEIPAFTFCSRGGYIYENVCKKAITVEACVRRIFFRKMATESICGQYPTVCIKGGTVLPKDFKPIFYQKFMQRYEFTQDDIDDIAIPLEDYMECTIEFAGKSEKCNLDNVLGSFYTPDHLPQFCYTIYSNWGNPDKKREMIPKGAKMKLHFFLNITQRPLDAPDRFDYDEGYPGPLFNPPAEPSVQMAVHSPYFLPSPYFDGTSFLVGKAYEIRIRLNERHLLEAPYQTNCTDYMKPWRQRGGKAPIHQLSIIQECRVNISYQVLGCVPLSIDYPHTFKICRACKPYEQECAYVEPQNNCTMLADHYNQPCSSFIYDVEKESKVVTLTANSDSMWANEESFKKILNAYECEGHKGFRPECSTIDIDVPFDRFEITNFTYNAKFESLELFSVIGGYMGMWLGISLLAIFQFADESVFAIKDYLTKKKELKKPKKKELQSYDNFSFKRSKQSYNSRSAW